MTRTKPPLADISIGGRMFKTEQKAFERFGAGLARELQIEIGKLSDDGARTGLDQAGERLRDAIAGLTEIATAMPDRRQGAKLLRVSLDLMFAAVDTASRVDHKQVPRITETVMKARAGKASGLARATKAERQWKNKGDVARPRNLQDATGLFHVSHGEARCREMGRRVTRLASRAH
jgi:hypothetical protein